MAATLEAMPTVGVLVRYASAVFITFFAYRILSRRYLSPLSDIPALNLLSAVSRWGKVMEVLSKRSEKNLLEAHKKHGE